MPNISALSEDLKVYGKSVTCQFQEQTRTIFKLYFYNSLMSNDAGKRQKRVIFAEGNHELLNYHTFDTLTAV